MKRYGSLVPIVLAMVAIFAGTASAQSSDRDNPTPMGSSEVSGTFTDHQVDGDKEVFYSFVAGPGKVTITFDVKRRTRDDMASFTFEVLPRNGSSTALLCCEGAQSGSGGTGREIATFQLNKRQTVILHITNQSNGGGSFHASLTGALAFTGAADGGGRPDDRGGNDNGDDEGHARTSGMELNVPATGTLHIRMRNGTTKDIDLSLIRSISVRQ
ncbi:MAG: hypothetical protein ACR2IH_00125 [Pyrinomonadaceae bacterium]